MPTYVRANREVLEFIRQIMAEYRPDLYEAEVTVDARWAIADDGPALKKGGYPCLAIVSITPLKQRVLGIADAVIDFDRTRWEELDDDEQAALVDHELHHLELDPDEDNDGRPKIDDHGRPKLRMRPHDWEIGGFTVIAQRHGEKAPEVRALRSALESTSQMVFAFEAAREPQEALG